MASKTESKEIPEKQQYLPPLQLRILELLRENGPMSRDQICEEFGFKKRKVVNSRSYYSYGSNGRVYTKVIRREVERYDQRTTIHDNLKKLQNRGIVEEIRGKSNGKRGRPPEFWKIKEGK